MPEGMKTNPPVYMAIRSQGPAINLVLQFLDDWAIQERLGPTGIELDGVYGEVGTRWMGQYQAARNIKADGICGPETWSAMAQDGTDFVRLANTLGPDVNTFAQPGGFALYWGPGIEPQETPHCAIDLLRAAHGEDST